MSPKTKFGILVGVVTVLAIGVVWRIVSHRDEPSKEPAAVASAPDKHRSETQASSTAKRPELYVVLDFQTETSVAETDASRHIGNVPLAASILLTSLSVETPSLGQQIADIFAASLEKSGATKVVRKKVSFSDAELKDANRTRLLRQELGADVVVGGRLSGESLTAISVRAEDAAVLGTSRATLKEVRTEELRAHIISVKGPVYLRPAGSNKVTRLLFGQALHPGDQIRCAPDGELTIRINSKIFRIQSGDSWFTVKAPLEPRRFEKTFQAVARGLFTQSEGNYIITVSR